MRLGIDAGSKFLKIVFSDNTGNFTPHTYCQHYGNPEKEIFRLIDDNGFKNIENIIFSGLHSNQLVNVFENASTADEISAIIESVYSLNNNFRYIVNVGAGSIKSIKLNDHGEFSSYTENSLCAAGTGSFLDEQMHRMNYSYSDIIAMPFIKDAPDIATRCAVFAKSDLIHRQQEGYTREEMWSGLCRGVVTTMLQSVFKGNVPTENILFSGGLFLNPLIRMWIEDTVKSPAFHPQGHFLSAIGSIKLNGKHKTKRPTNLGINKKEKNDKLNILKSIYPKNLDFSAKEQYVSNDLEIRIHKDKKNNQHIAIGIDIGSTSTKLVVLDSETLEVMIDIYGKTNGNPVNATKKLFSQLKNILNNKNYIITSTGTTGSGRKLIGKIIGADIIINEITAHFKGATFFDKTIETIFEIGGQDSKYIRGQSGNVVDCNMNFVCAAGTGSFIEEQANRLGFDIKDIGDLVMGLQSPHTSDRCTVFMEQDINKLIKEGFTREEVLAGVIRSICKNYLNRVVGSRPVTGEKVFFQGATARNKGLVAAFENILGKEIIVSPYCHVIGAFGAALLSVNRLKNNSSFRGLDIFETEIELEYNKCDQCANMCKISTARFSNGASESWGFMCGKETLDEKRKNNSTDHFQKIHSLLNKKLKKKAGKIKNKKSLTLGKVGIPFVLSMYNHIPLWKTFLEQLGFEVILSDKSTQTTKEEAIRLAKSEFCFPIKLSLAHYKKISAHNDIDILFFPSTLSEPKQANNMPRMLCPYVITYTSIARESLTVEKDIISPCIDFRQKKEVIINELYENFKRFNLSINDISNAYTAGMRMQMQFLHNRYSYGSKLLEELKEKNKKGIICLGRPYNLYDKIINLGLTDRLKNNDDIIVFPYEYFIDPEDNDSGIDHMYWNYGEKILSVAKKIRNIENMYPVYFTNFSCGPDSFILSRFEEIMKGKPYLIIELDEHGSETGYLTRVEAFLDVITEKEKTKSKTLMSGKKFSKSWNKKEKKIWFPPMFEIAPRFFAAAFRGYGFDAEALPVENNEAFELGKQNTRGSECLPACTTIGGFLQKMRDINAIPANHALFMPTAEGPCRFGQYSTLHKSILMRNGMEEAEIFSPTSSNSYMGMSSSLTRYLLDIIASSDILSKRIYSIRPYEINPGQTDQVSEKILYRMETQIEKKKNLIQTTGAALTELSRIPVNNNNRPLVGIVGEIYVRSNPFSNNNVIRYIEANGGEAWLSPMSEWVIYTAWMEKFFARLNKVKLHKKIGVNMKTTYMINRLHRFEHELKDYIPGRTEPPIERVLEAGKRYVPLEFEGETILTIGRTIAFLEDGASMVVNCAPFSCMPGNITTTIFQNIQKDFNKPIINLFYDGESDVNRIIGIYLNNIRKESMQSSFFS